MILRPVATDIQVDVTIPLQCLVQDSELHLTASSKVHCLSLDRRSSQAHLNGFYDPCIDEPKVCSSSLHSFDLEKQLKIKYLCMGRLHEVTYDDESAVRLPMRAHLIPE